METLPLSVTVTETRLTAGGPGNTGTTRAEWVGGVGGVCRCICVSCMYMKTCAVAYTLTRVTVRKTNGLTDRLWGGCRCRSRCR